MRFEEIAGDDRLVETRAFRSRFDARHRSVTQRASELLARAQQNRRQRDGVTQMLLTHIQTLGRLRTRPLCRAGACLPRTSRRPFVEYTP